MKAHPIVGIIGGLANAYTMYRNEKKRDEWLERMAAAGKPKTPDAAPAGPAPVAVPATPANAVAPAATPAAPLTDSAQAAPAAGEAAAPSERLASNPTSDYEQYKEESDRLFNQDQTQDAPAVETPAQPIDTKA